MIIDSHVHVDTASKEDLTKSSDALLFEMDRLGVEAAVVMPIAGPTYKPREDCDRLIELTQKNNRLFPVAAFDLECIKDSNDTISDYIKNRAVVGIKFFTGYQPIDILSEEYSSIFNILESSKIPALFHTGATSLLEKSRLKYCADHFKFDDLAYTRPGLRMNCAHFNAPKFLEMAVVMETKKNIHADLSGLIYSSNEYNFNPYIKFLENNLYEAISYLGSIDRFMFGTDYPICSMHNSLDFFKHFFKKYEFAENEKEQILANNAIAFYGLNIK